MRNHKLNKEQALELLKKENFKRKTLSFYKYIIIQEPDILRDNLYNDWAELGVLGRIYLAKEGVNAQLSVPEHNWDKFKENTSKINCTPNLSIIANELKKHIDEKDNYAILELKKFYFDKLKNNQIKIGEGMRYLRLCITGEISGPDLFTIIEILDKDIIIERIDKSLKKIND